MLACGSMKLHLQGIFAVTDFVKQGCVLAPTLFSLYLTAMLKAAFDGIGNVNVPLFKAKTRTT